MGQVGSLPDGSELKEPEEKVSPSTLVNANFGLVFVKPHAHKPDVIDFVKDELRSGVYIHPEYWSRYAVPEKKSAVTTLASWVLHPRLMMRSMSY